MFLDSTSYRAGHWIPFDFPAIWQTYPLTALTATQKFYYLSQSVPSSFPLLVSAGVETDRTRLAASLAGFDELTRFGLVGCVLARVTHPDWASGSTRW